LEFICPSRIRVPINTYAIIRKEGFSVIVESDFGPYVVGADVTVSRRTQSREGHAKIFVKQDGLYIQDLGSKNGTVIDGNIIKGWQRGKPSDIVKVEPGQNILIGVSTCFKIAVGPPPIIEPKEEKMEEILEGVLSEVRVKLLSIPCPECGAPQYKPVLPGERVLCEYCRSIYSIEEGLSALSEERLKRRIILNAIEDAIKKYDARLNALINDLCDYAERVLSETLLFYETQRRLPTKEELDRKVEEETKKFLRA